MMWLFFKQKIRWVAGVTLIVCAGGLASVFWVNHLLKKMETSVPTMISQRLKIPVEIKQTSIYWSGFDITVRLQDVTGSDPDVKVPFFTAQTVELNVSVLDWLRTRSVHVNQLSLTGAQFVVGVLRGWDRPEIMGLNQTTLPQNIDLQQLQAGLEQLSKIKLKNLQVVCLTPVGEWNQTWSGKWSWRNRSDRTWEFHGEHAFQAKGRAPVTHALVLRAQGMGDQIALSMGKPLAIQFDAETPAGKKQWNWTLTGKDLDVGFIKTVLPNLSQHKNTPAWVLWLANSLEKGQIKRMVWQGADSLTGRVDFENADLNYHADWPKLETVSGAFKYENNRWTADAVSGDVFQIPTQGLKAQGFIEDAVYRVQVEGNLKTTLERGLVFLKQSPLKGTAGHLFRHVSVQGNLALALKLDVPLSLKEEAQTAHKPIKVLGTLQIQDGVLDDRQASLRVAQVNGALRFTESSLRGDFPQVSAEFPIPKPFAEHWPAQGNLRFSLSWNAEGFAWAGRFADAWDVKLKWVDGKPYHGHVLFNPGKQQTAHWPSAQDKTILLTAPQFQARVGDLDFVGRRAEAPLVLKFSFLKLPDLAETAAHKQTIADGWQSSDWRQVIHFQSDSTWLGRRFLGQVSFKASPTQTGWDIEALHITQANLSLKARGQWNTKTSETSFTGDAVSKRVGELLNGWDAGSDLREGELEAHFSVRWPGDPSQLLWQTLLGDASLNIQNGRLIGVEPGFGRFMGLLSIENLKRRLKLDFSDLFKKGFVFDQCRSNLRFESGKIVIKNMEVKGPSADLNITGSTDIKTQRWSLYVRAIPKSTASFPLAAAIAVGNPAVGAGMWVLDKITGSNLSKVSGMNYQVTGTWQEPNIKKVPSLEKQP